ncbi:MAG: ABC transporter permease [Planctomycetota bacterium]
MNTRGALIKFCNVAGLPVLEPFVRLAFGEDPKEQFKGIAKFILVPFVAVGLFLATWSAAAKLVVTDSMKLPGPGETWDAGKQLFAMHFEQRAADAAKQQEKAGEAVQLFIKAKAMDRAAQSESNAERKEALLAQSLRLKRQAVNAANYVPSSAPTFIDQIFTSLKTVFFGFLVATLIAVPVGILCGMSPWFNAALNPFIQVFKPVSPLAWLPLAGLVIIWWYSSLQSEPFFSKAFLISAITVSLCSLWPTLVNTTLGVASVDKDYLNVARVLQLSWSQRLFKIILPASLPLMFAGLRISLGVGWMVLIAADMLAQNPGLGKFVWDEFQNGSSLTYARIAFSVLVIGFIGLLLDRVMIFLRNLVSFGNPAAA